MIAEEFTGYRPAVGEIRAVRTFRVGRHGQLRSLSSAYDWPDGPAEASCLTGEHDAAADGCTCGLYAYASPGAAEQDRRATHVLAIVACWGRVVAGTRGLRAQYARVEALWLSAAVPDALVRDVAARYPSVRLYRDRAAMLERHPLTVLDCYEPTRRSRVGLVVGGVAATAAATAPLASWTAAVLVWAGLLLVLGLGLVQRRAEGRQARSFPAPD